MNTTTQQPEPLRLADALENGSYLLSVERAATCAELRRLHAIEAEHIKLCRDYQDTWDSRDRLHAENQQLRADLEAIGAGGVGPLMPATVQHQHKSNIDNDLQRENGQLITSSSTAPAGWKLVPVEPTREMLRAAIDAPRPAVYVDSLSAAENLIDSTKYRAMLAAAPQPPVVDRPNVDPCKDGSCDCCWTDKPQPQGEEEPVAEITGMDEYGPMLGWHKHWAEFPVGTKLHTHPQRKITPKIAA